MFISEIEAQFWQRFGILVVGALARLTIKCGH
jgi:hypothetical protein